MPEEIPTDDEGAFALMRSGNMDGLFQVEGALYVSLFKRLPPQPLLRHRRIDRPQPSGPARVRHGRRLRQGGEAAQTPVHYYDDRLRPVLEETHGTMVYQEQIMQISMVMSGFSAGKSDKLRKAMGKKKIDIMRRLQADWDSTVPSRTAIHSTVAQHDSGMTPRSSRSTRSTSRTRLHTPSWSCARLT